MNKIILATILSVILLTTPFASVSAQSPEEKKLKEENAKLKQEIKELIQEIISLKKENAKLKNPEKSQDKTKSETKTSDKTAKATKQSTDTTKASKKIQGLSTQASHSSFTGKDLRLNPIPNKILTEDNFYAELVPSSIQVIEKERYNVITLSINVNVKDLPFDGKVEFRDLYTTLKDEKSKSYSPDKKECSLSEYIQINGKVTDTATYKVCYSVDKSSTKFSIFYTEPIQNYHMTRIGHLSLDQALFDYYESNRSSTPHKIGIVNLR